MQKVIKMLNAVPEGAGEQETQIWKGMRPLQIKLLLKNWVKVEQNESILDECNFAIWKKDGWTHVGMRHDSTGLSHGVVRSMHPNLGIQEATYRNGKLLGLSREIFSTGAEISLNKDGRRLSYFEYDAQF